MTENEAKKYMLIEKECINRDCDRDCANCDIVQNVEDLNNAYDIAINILEKQIPKKIEIRKATNDDIESELRDFITVKGRICRCPSCRCCIHISELKYCWECGQKLDWSDEE